jgi:hypothetical protein
MIPVVENWQFLYEQLRVKTTPERGAPERGAPERGAPERGARKGAWKGGVERGRGKGGPVAGKGSAGKGGAKKGGTGRGASGMWVPGRRGRREPTFQCRPNFSRFVPFFFFVGSAFLARLAGNGRTDVNVVKLAFFVTDAPAK